MTPSTPSTATGTVRRRIPSLEGYRGLAALGIVIFHAYQFNRGNTAGRYPYAGSAIDHVLRNLDGLVSLFFVLSGYLMYAPLCKATVDTAPREDVRVFLFRRAVRILPLYWIAVILVWAYRNPTLPGDWRDLVEHLTFLQVFDSKRIFYTIGPAWSLSVEVIFYLFIAALYLTFSRISWDRLDDRARLRRLYLAPLSLIVAGLAWNGWALFVAHEPATRWAIWFNPLAKASMFGCGMLVAVIARRTHPVTSRGLLAALRLAALALLAIGCLVRTDEAVPANVFNQLATVAFALLIASSVLAPNTDRINRALTGAALARLALISYSLYLWHEPVLLWLDTHLHLNHDAAYFPLTAALLVTASLPLAQLSYQLIERPFNNLRTIMTAQGTRYDRYEAVLTTPPKVDALPVS